MSVDSSSSSSLWKEKKLDQIAQNKTQLNSMVVSESVFVVVVAAVISISTFPHTEFITFNIWHELNQIHVGIYFFIFFVCFHHW